MCLVRFLVYKGPLVPSKKLKWPILIFHNWKTPYKGIIEIQEIMKVGLSETHASENREDEKPTDGTSTSKKDQDGNGTMKSENC